MSNKAWEEYLKLKQEVTCGNCKFYDGICCMYKCALKAILYEDKSAKECGHFTNGEYNQDNLEETNYM